MEKISAASRSQGRGPDALGRQIGHDLRGDRRYRRALRISNEVVGPSGRDIAQVCSADASRCPPKLTASGDFRQAGFDQSNVAGYLPINDGSTISEYLDRPFLWK